MADLAKIILPSGDEYNFKDAQAREHIQDHNNPHQVTAEQAGAISKMPDYSFRKVAGWYRFLTINISAGQSNSIWLLVQDTYSSDGGAESYKAIISFYITRASSGGFSSSAYFLTGYGFTKDRFHYTYDASSGDVSIYVYKNTNNNGDIGVTVISSLNRSGSYVDLSDNFESTAISTLPEGSWHFNAMQDGAGNVIPDTYATKDELLSTVINKNDIGSSTDIDTLTAPGMWYSSTGLQTNWPNQGKPGRLVVFGSTSATNSRKVQLVVCNTNNVDDAEFYYRIGISNSLSSTWGSWTRVATEADLDGLIASKIYFGESTTAAATQTKTCSITGISSYYDGLMVRILFTNAQTYNGTPKLNINNLGAKGINAVRYEWAANSIVDMVFDNSSDSWRIVRGGKATTTYYGLTKLSSSVSSTSTALAATPSAVKTAYDRANAVAADLATVEATSTASTSYAVGKHLMLGGVLYEVTAAIAVGETIAQGTNVTPVTVMESMAAMDIRLSNELAESNAVAFGIPYEGVNLTVKFADEISQYSDPWEWIHNRIVDGNWTGLHIGDYIPFTTTESSPKTYQAQIAGINTYTYYGDIDVGRHIDFICRTLWRTVHPMNPVDFNNGTKFGDGAAIEYPWLASDLYLWLNSLGGVVPNATTAGGGTGELVDYSSSGVLYYLPTALKRNIVEKRAYLPKRYNSSELRSDDNGGGWVNIGWLWLPSEFEVYGAPVWGGKGGYSTMGNCVQYPIFAHNMNRVKTVGGARAYWWVLSVYSGSTKNWCCVYANGLTNYTNADNPNVFVPVCFRIK